MSDKITFAGQPVILDIDGKLQRAIADKWPGGMFPAPGQRREFRPIGTALLGADIGSRIQSPYGDWPDPRLNELVIPTGSSRWAKGLIAVTRQAAHAIAQQCYGYSSADAASLDSLSSWGSKHTPASLAFSFNGQTFSRSLYPLTPVRLDRLSNDLWLIPLVDERYYWQWEPSDLRIAPQSSWGDVLSRFGGGSASGPLSPDVETLREYRGPKGALIDAVALSCGLRPVMTSSGIKLQNASDAASALAGNFTLSGIQFGYSVPSYPLPGSVDLVHRVAQDYSGGCKRLKVRNIAFDNEGSKPSKIHLPTTCWSMELEGVETSQSRSSLTSLAAAMKSAITGWASKSYCGAFAGSPSWEMSGFDDFISIGAYRAGGRMRIGLSATGASPLILPAVQLSQSPANYVHPSDFALFLLKEPLASAGKAKALIDKSLDPLIDGSVINIDIGSAGSDFEADDIVLAQFQCGEDPPWRVVTSTGAGGGLIPFELLETLLPGKFQPGVKADAKFPASNEDTVELLVKDTKGTYKALAGAKGLGLPTGEYEERMIEGEKVILPVVEIVEIQHIARLINFQLDSALDSVAGWANAKAIAWYDGENPVEPIDPQDPDSEKLVRVYRTLTTGSPPTSSVGWAAYNHETDHYEIIITGNLPLLIAGNLERLPENDTDLEPHGLAIKPGYQAKLTSISIKTTYPYSLPHITFDGVTVNNPYQLTAGQLARGLCLVPAAGGSTLSELDENDHVDASSLVVELVSADQTGAPQYAKRLKVTLNADLTGPGSVSCTVNGGIDGPLHPIDYPSGTVISVATEFAVDSVAGKKARAEWNHETNSWDFYVIDCAT